MYPYTALCTYQVKPANVEQFRALLLQHWPTLRRLGLVTSAAPSIYYGETDCGPFFVEIMTWADESAPSRAYWMPEVNDIWTQLYEFTEPRRGHPAIEYPKVTAVALSDAALSAHAA